jgi:hypothetical protein
LHSLNKLYVQMSAEDDKLDLFDVNGLQNFSKDGTVLIRYFGTKKWFLEANFYVENGVAKGKILFLDFG